MERKTAFEVKGKRARELHVIIQSGKGRLHHKFIRDNSGCVTSIEFYLEVQDHHKELDDIDMEINIPTPSGDRPFTNSSLPAFGKLLEWSFRVERWMCSHGAHAKDEYINGCPVCIYKSRLVGIGDGKERERASLFFQSQVGEHGKTLVNAIIRNVNRRFLHDPQSQAPEI